MQTSDIKKALFSFMIVPACFAAFPSIESIALASDIPAPLLPDTGTAVASTTAPAEITPDRSAPVTLSIPAIGLKDTVIGVGTNSKGEMDVPSGATENVGWYKYGTTPGQIGSAVLDAHVFAAFAELHRLKVGDSIDVVNESGQTLEFKIEETKTYKLADVPADKLFNRTDEPRLNLITCAGQLTPEHSTYDHRLVIYAVLFDTK